MLRRLSTGVAAAVAMGCTPASVELPLPASGGGSGGASEGGGDGPGDCVIDGELWVDNVDGDNANAATEVSPVADLDAALARAGECTRIHMRATAVGYRGACIARAGIEVVGEGGRPLIDQPVTCDGRLVGLFVRADHVRISGLAVDVSAHGGEQARAVVLSGVPEAPIADVTVLDVVATGPGPGAEGRALLSSSLCFGCAFESCTASGSEGAGIGFDNHQDDAIIRGNRVTNTGDGCVVVNGEPSAAIPGDSVLDGVSSGVLVERNVLSGCGGPAIHLASAVSGRIVDNVVTATTAGALRLDDDGVGDPAYASRDHLIAHNTFDCTLCLVPAIRLLAGSIGNRLVDGLVVAPDAVVELAADVRADVVFDHNGYATAIGFVDADGAPIGLTQWQALGFDQGSIAVPTETTFVDPVSGDLHLRAGSPTIDAGIDVGVELDADAGPRLVGAAPDLGAYEFDG